MLKFIFSNPWKTIWEIFKTVFGIVGGSYAFVEIAANVYPKIEWLHLFQSHFKLLCIVALVIGSVVTLLPLREFTCKIKDYDVNITLQAGKIEKRPESIIISTNSSFVTVMEDDIISPSSAQGAFQLAFYKNNLQELDSQIKKALKREHKCGDLRLKGKTYPVYDVGTVAKITQNNRRVYFLALNSINQHGQNIDHSIDMVFSALEGLWRNIIEKGNTENVLSIPLIASGRAGIAEATKDTVIKAIVDSFIATIQNSSSVSTKHLRIIIYPEDIEKVNLPEIKDYIQYRCAFAKKDSSVRIGNRIP